MDMDELTKTGEALESSMDDFEKNLGDLKQGHLEMKRTLLGAHPILKVAGQYLKVDAIVGLSLENGDAAFSISTRRVIECACGAPERFTESGEPVIGLASFMRACIALGMDELDSSGKARSTHASAIVAEHVSKQRVASATLESLKALTSSDPERIQRAIAGGSLTQALAEAAKFADGLPATEMRVDLVHAVLAALKTSAAQRVFFEIGAIGPRPLDFLRSLFLELIRTLPQDDRKALDPIAHGFGLDPNAAPNRSQAHYVADAPAVSLADDRLGVETEARALAEVICLRAPGPPLAIGLFGEWGSGKSTLMNMVEAAIDGLCERARSSETTKQLFVKRVVHIRFNAWHYNDADLWASLASEFLSQLRAGGHDKRARAEYAALVAEVAKRAAESSAEVRRQSVAAAEASRSAVTLRSEIDALETKRNSEKARVISEILPAAIEAAQETHPAELQAAFARLGHPIEVPEGKSHDPAVVKAALSARAQDLGVAAARALTFPIKVATLTRAVLKDRSARRLLLLLVAMSGCTGLILRLVGTRATANAIALVATAPAVLGLVAFAKACLKLYRIIEPIFRIADQVRTKRTEMLAEVTSQIEKKTQALREAEERERHANEFASKNAIPFSGGTPREVLDYFLLGTSEAKALEGQLGVVSRVRRIFEQLDAILREQRDQEQMNGSARPVGETPAPSSATKDADTAIDRIVLYIDDLDRCAVKTVVNVLEAVHLMLAFPLFVVIVGVDPRWLKHSLITTYDRQIRDGVADRESSNAEPRPSDERATVQDYLEKIFQIPVRLRSHARRDDESFLDYVRFVAGPIEQDGEGESETARTGTHREPTHERAAVEAAAGEPSKRLQPLEVKLRPGDDDEQMIKRVALRREEVELVGQLSPILGKSPRAVKRFMNIYRVARGLHRGAGLEAFLMGDSQNPARYPAILFWLSLDIGVSAELARAYRDAISACAKEGRLSLVDLASTLQSDGDPEPAAPAVTALKNAVAATDRKRHADALKAVGSLLPEPTGLSYLLAARDEVVRFSFQAD